MYRTTGYHCFCGGEEEQTGRPWMLLCHTAAWNKPWRPVFYSSNYRTLSPSSHCGEFPLSQNSDQDLRSAGLPSSLQEGSRKSESEEGFYKSELFSPQNCRKQLSDTILKHGSILQWSKHVTIRIHWTSRAYYHPYHLDRLFTWSLGYWSKGTLKTVALRQSTYLLKDRAILEQIMAIKIFICFWLWPEHVTPASSLCPQSGSSSAAGQDHRLSSLPVQFRSSKYTGPRPGGKEPPWPVTLRA